MTLVTNATFTPASSTLSAVTFRMVASGYRYSGQAYTSVEPVPWGTYVIEHRSGRGAPSLNCKAYFTASTTATSSSDFDAMMDLRGEKGTLIWPMCASTAGKAATLETCEMGDEIVMGAVAASMSFTVGTS